MANKLLEACEDNRQRALTEDSKTICVWFNLVEATRLKYGILDEDTFNFDKTRFMMSVVLWQLVVTGS